MSLKRKINNLNFSSLENFDVDALKVKIAYVKIGLEDLDLNEALLIRVRIVSDRDLVVAETNCRIIDYVCHGGVCARARQKRLLNAAG